MAGCPFHKKNCWRFPEHWLVLFNPTSDKRLSLSAASQAKRLLKPFNQTPLHLDLFRCENPPFEAGYGFVSPSSFASWASSILTGRSLGKVQFLKRCGMTA